MSTIIAPMSDSKIRPDISNTLRHWTRSRRERAMLSFGEKIAMAQALNKCLAPLKNDRQKLIATEVLRKLASEADAPADGNNDTS